MNRKMSLERAVEAFAGAMILVSVALTYYVHPQWMWLTVFIGVNLFQQSFTGLCPAAILLKKAFGLRSADDMAHAA